MLNYLFSLVQRARRSAALALVFCLTLTSVITPAVPAMALTTSGSLSIDPMSAYNFIVDSNVLSPSTYAPEAGTLGARVCNTGGAALTDVFVYIGNETAGTPGVYPSRSHAGLQGTFSLTHEGGSAGTRDASRYIPRLDPGECAMQYWLVSYPRTAISDGTVFGGAGTEVAVTLGIKPNDDLFLFYDVWATANQGGTPLNVTEERRVTMRNEISAAANKIWPNTTSKVPQEYLDAIATALGWDTFTPSGGTVAYPGQTVTTQGIWYDLGNVGFGFDNNGDGVPDQNAWLQPIGDPNSYDPGCFRLVRSFGILIVKLKSGGEQLIPFVDKLYFENIAENTGVVGLVYYQYAALDGSCTAGLSPYQEVASGYDNEKFSGDYGFGIPPLVSRTPAVTFVKSVSPIGSITTTPTTLTYNIAMTNSAAEPAQFAVTVGDPDLGIPLVITDKIPDGTDFLDIPAAFQPGQLVSSVAGNVRVASIRYSTNNRASWTTTLPPANTVTDIQWWMDRGVPQGDTVTVQFRVTAPVDPPTITSIAVIPNTAEASFGTAPPFARSTVTTPVQGPNSLSGNVFRDNGAGGLFGNSIYDSGSGEILLPDITVDLYFDSDGDGVIDPGEPLITTTAATYTGFYNFTNLPDGRYIVQVNKLDPQVPTGWTNTTRTLRTAALDPTGVGGATPATVTGLNFGFAPALTLDKQLVNPTSPVYEGELITFDLDVFNRLPGSGTAATACSYVIPASIDFPTTNPGGAAAVPDGGGPDNAQWSSTPNALGLPDGVYAGTNMNNNADLLGLSGFNLGDQGGTITNVKYRFIVRERLEMRAGDYMAVQLYYNETALSTKTQFTGNVAPFSNGLVGSVYSHEFDITALRAWTWADFNSNLTEVEVEGTSAGGNPAGEIDLDAFEFVVTTNQTCGGDDTIISTVPLTDTYDADLLQFVSATIPPDSATTTGTAPNTIGNLSWNNIGPLYPSQNKTIQATFRVLATSVDNVATTNFAGVTNPRYRNGLPANNAYDSVPITINRDSEINGRVFIDVDNSGWSGTTGDNAGDVGIANVRVELYGCVDIVTGRLYSVSGTLPAGTNRDCTTQAANNTPTEGTVGAWVLLQSTNTDAGGNYSFKGLRPGFYVVQVADGSPVLTGGLSTTTLPSGLTARTEADDSQTANAGFNCGTCNAFWGNTGSNLTTGNFNPIDIANETINNVDFGYTMLQSGLYGRVWHDYNADGVIDGNEPALAGVTVNRCTALPCSGGNILGTATTGANGNYSFTNIPAGTYFISIVTTSGALSTGTWVNTFDTTVPGATPNDSVSGGIALPANTFAGSYNFGYRQTGTLQIGDTLYYDWDADGTQDNGAIVEEGIRNMTVNLYLDVNADGSIDTTNDRLVATTTTDVNGNYLFSNLPPGRYYVYVDRSDPDLPAAYIQTQDPDEAGVCTICNSRSLAVLTNDSNLNQDFGYRPTGVYDIGDTVWYDRNGDRVQSGVQEVGLPNVTVNLRVDLNGDGVFVTVRTVVTDANGKYLFENLPPATYQVVVDTADADIPNDPFGNNYAPTTPTTQTVTPAMLIAATNGIYNQADFGFTTLAAIGDTVYYDTNNNGQQDYGEPGINGVVVTLTNTSAYTDTNGVLQPANSLVLTRTTNITGTYFFSGLPALSPATGGGVSYSVTVSAGGGTPINGQPQTADPDRDGVACGVNINAPGADPYSACNHATTQRLYPGSIFTGADFGYLPTGVLGDTLWIDADNDGVRDAEEYGIPYVTVRIIGPGCAGPAGCVRETDPNGEYSFAGLADGTYTVEVVTTDPDFAPLVAAGLIGTYEPNGSINNLITVTMAGGVITQVDGTNTPSLGNPGTPTTCTAGGSCSLVADFGYRFSSGALTISGTVCLDGTVTAGLCGTGTSGVDPNPANGEVAYPTRTVSLYRWTDVNNNGTRDGGEVALAAFATTDANGDYSFTNLPATSGNDRYIVVVNAPAQGLSLTTPTGGEVTQVAADGANISATRTFALITDQTNKDFAYVLTRGLDFGDLPASYSTTLSGSPSAARHSFTLSGSPEVFLGTAPDAENDGQATPTAIGDGADENGVAPTSLVRWQTGTNGGSVTVTVAGSNGGGWLMGWIDFNRDDDFNDAGEIVMNRAVSNGTANYAINVPADIFGTGTTNISLPSRFRVFTSQPAIPSLAYSGEATGGEVEDYVFVFTPNSTTLTELKAVKVGEGAVVNWATATELGVVGFEVLRSDSGQRADAVALNEELIFAEGDGVGGASYSFSDPTPLTGSTRYWLLVINSDGPNQEFGPVMPASQLGNAGTTIYLPILNR